MKNDTKRKIIIISAGLGIILFSIVSMMWLASFNKRPPKSPPKEVIKYVKTSPVKYSNKVITVSANGRVNSKSEIVLSAEVSGKILKGDIPFKSGQSFKKGDLLVRIYDSEAELDLKAKRSVFLNRLANVLPEFKITFTDSYETWLKYFESVDINNDLPDLPETKTTQEKVYLSSFSVLSDYYSIRRDESKFRKYKIYAPFDGTITSANMEVGAIANPGTQLANIINTNELEIEIPVEVKDAKWLKKGQEVQLKSDNKFIEWTGKISRISNSVNVNTQSINVYVDVRFNPAKPLFKGQYLTALFGGIKLFDVMEIPRNAVFNSNEVYVVDDSILVKKKINVEKIAETTLFFSGLKEGEDVVNEPLISASENMKVKKLSEIKKSEKVKEN